MPSETQYAASVTAYVRDGEGGAVAVHSPTFYLHPDVQGITNEAHAKSILTDWLQRISEHSEDVSFDVAVAATTVDTPDPQANALLRAVKRSQTNASLVFVREDSYDINLEVVEANVPSDRHAFVCGIAPDGRSSS